MSPESNSTKLSVFYTVSASVLELVHLVTWGHLVSWGGQKREGFRSSFDAPWLSSAGSFDDDIGGNCVV